MYRFGGVSRLSAAAAINARVTERCRCSRDVAAVSAMAVAGIDEVLLEGAVGESVYALAVFGV
jgi:hypothetical protein